MFNPNFITKVATTAFIGLSTILGGTPAAEAYEVRFDCGQIRGWQTCVSYQDSNSPDILYVQGPTGKSTISIRCFEDGSYRWNGFGVNGQSFDEYVAEGFCRD